MFGKSTSRSTTTTSRSSASLIDQLRDIGHLIPEPITLLNLHCGLNPRYCYVKLVITFKFLSHTFISARFPHLRGT